MTESTGKNLHVDAVLRRYQGVPQRSYQVSSITAVVNGINAGKDVVIDLPTGMGKTFIYSPVAAEAAESGMRVAILAATKQAQKRIKGDVERFSKSSIASLIYGISEYDCPLLKGKAQVWCCNDNKEAFCIPTNIGCDVIKTEDAYNKQSLIVTNFSKFLLASREKGYDLVIVDDSHSFENTKEQAYQVSIQFGPIKEFYLRNQSENTFYEFIATFLNIYTEIFERSVNPDELDSVISAEYVKHLAEDLLTEENSEQIQEAIRSLPEPARSQCLQIFYFVERAKKSSNYQFYIRKDFYAPDDIDSSELISRWDERTIEHIIRKRFGSAKVIFATATPGDTKIHAQSCTLRHYDDSGLSVIPGIDSHVPEVESWFEKLSIIVVEDIGDTKNREEFNKATQLSTEILMNINKRALLLFKNYRDQKAARDILSSTFGSDKLFFIDSSIQNSDELESYASNHQISLASASSTVWEGININKLRLVMIMSPPFIRPPVGSNSVYAYGERRMLMRLQQGIGRIIRDPNDFGAAILVSNKFRQYLGKKMFSERLKKNVKYVKSSDVVLQLKAAFSEWEK